MPTFLKTVRGRLCWLLGHSYLTVGTIHTALGSCLSWFKCQHCGAETDAQIDP